MLNFAEVLACLESYKPYVYGTQQPDLCFSDITFDSRACRASSLFICKGASFIPSYLDDAVRNGASACITQSPISGASIPQIVVSDIRSAMADLACTFFKDPSSALNVIGITGTKGKTSTSFFLDGLLRARSSQSRSGLAGGLVNRDGIRSFKSRNTTMESVELQRFLASCVDNGCDAVAMEVSSQGLKYHRTQGIHFAAAAFLNISPDHISENEHPTYEDYLASKLSLFDQSELAVINCDEDTDDSIRTYAASRCSVMTFSAKGLPADVRLLHQSRQHNGQRRLLFDVCGQQIETRLGVLGDFNVSNALAAISCAYCIGVDVAQACTGLEQVRIPGRMELYASKTEDVIGIVDYAHNGVSMQALLECIRQEYPDRELTVVFGSTGLRGQNRREGLGRAAARLADRIILTEDDPDDVPVAEICKEIGMYIQAEGNDYIIVEDRRSAVHLAVQGSTRPSVVVLAGKGTESSMRRANGDEPCETDASMLCRELGIEFDGYEMCY